MSLLGWGKRNDPRSELDRLVARAQAGDPQAQEELFGRISALMYQVVRSVVRPEDVEDAVQEVRLRIFRSLNQYQASVPGHFMAWVAVVARSVAIDFVRRNRARLRHEMTFNTPEERDAFQELIAAPEPQPLSDDLKERIREAIEKLSPREREMVTLHYLTGYTYGEIAEIKGLSERTVRTFLQRARSKLREYLR